MVFYLTKFVYVWQYSNGEPVFVYKNRLSNYPAPVCLWHGCVSAGVLFSEVTPCSDDDKVIQIALPSHPAPPGPPGPLVDLALPVIRKKVMNQSMSYLKLDSKNNTFLMND